MMLGLPIGCTPRWVLLAAMLAMLTPLGMAFAQDKGRLGAEIKDLTKEEADKLSLPQGSGVRVTRLIEGSPAAAAGLLSDDIILSFDGSDVISAKDLIASIQARSPGEQVILRVLRGGAEQTMIAILAGTRTIDEGTPQLMLDTGGHTSLILGLVLTAGGKQLVSAGNDKIIRIWDWQSGSTVRTIRGQVGQGPEGRIYAIALSPDARLLAAAGWMAPGYGVRNSEIGDIRLYDFSNGNLIGLLRGHADAVNSLAFSPDGKLLLSGSTDNTAILWDVVGRQPRRQLVGHTGFVYATGITRDGQRAVTGSFDSTLKLWSVIDGKEIATLKGHKDKVYRLAISPSDGSIASGSVDGEIRLWDEQTGTFLRTLVAQNTAVGALSFSADGKRLLSGSATLPTVVRVWDVATGKELITYPKHDNIVAAAVLSPDGRFAVSGGGNQSQIHVWDTETAETKKILVGTGTQVWAVGISTDGRRIAAGRTPIIRSLNDRGPLDVQVRLPAGIQGMGRPEKLTQQASAMSTAWFRGRAKFGAFELGTRKGGIFGYDAFLDIKKDGQTLASIERGFQNGYQHRAFTFSPNGKLIISGGDNGVLTAFDLTGKSVGDFLGHEGEVWAVAPSPDGRLVISGGADQTVRLWNLATHELIVTLFVGLDGEWVTSTPQGYYMSSPNGERLVGWQISKGPDQTSEYVVASQLRTHFYRPDIVEKAIILASATAAVNQMSGKEFLLSDLLTHKPPGFDILSPADKSHASMTPIQMRLQLVANADPIENIEVLVNGRQATTPGMRNATARLATTPTLERSVEVPLEQGENQIRIVARNKVGQTERDITLFRDNPGLLDQRGTLYVLAIGVDKYAQLPPTCGPNGNQSCDLRYAGKDARAFRDVMAKHAAPLFGQIKTLLLTIDGDRPPTKANIEDALEEMLGKAGPADTTELFIAGHGVTDDRGAEYIFLPEGAEIAGQSWRRSSVVSWNEFQGALQKTLGRRLMFVDTCHSGGAYNNRLVNDAANANIIVFSATDSETLSWEFENLGHGAFTYSLIQGIEGKAPRRPDGSMSVLALGDFISQEVAGLTQNKQQPTFHMSGAKNFALATQASSPVVPALNSSPAKETGHKARPKSSGSWWPGIWNK